MGKRKRNNTQHANTTKKQTTSGSGIPSPPSEINPLEPSNVYSVISKDEIEVSVDTLQTLSEHPNLIKSKACKELRTAVYSFRQACTTGLNSADGSNLTARISAALTDAKYLDALILLAEMRIRKETPSLGALCRWVRTLDVVSGLSIHVEVEKRDVVGKNAGNEELIRVLDGILRVTGPTDSTTNGMDASSSPICLQETWDLRQTSEPTRQLRRSVADRTIFADLPPDFASRFTILETTPGADRKPPNLHPAILYTCTHSTIPLSPTPPSTSVHTHPVVPNLRLIKDVLSPSECAAIVAAGELTEFIPDAPIRPQGEDTSILAHNFYWIVDKGFHDKLWERVRSFVPESVGGRKVRGINRRFRVYRYVPGAEYRMHIDGAWPPSGIQPASPTQPAKYLYDASPPSARQSSLFTFLIYLNDDFKGGETTFFIPSVREGVISAYPVKPIMGSVAVFPHGEAAGALLHEGTGVVEGAKYVIRTDVEYDVDVSV